MGEVGIACYDMVGGVLVIYAGEVCMEAADCTSGICNVADGNDEGQCV